MNDYNYVRSEYLEIYSLEFVAVLFFIFSIIIYRKKGIFFIFALSLPFTDQVYKFYGFSISDFLSLLILIIYFNDLKGKVLNVLPFLFLFLIGFCVCVLIHEDLIAVMYGFKFILNFLIFLIFSEKLKIDYLRDNFIFGYKYIFICSVIFAIFQAFFWVLGFKVAGVFFMDGIIRVKGLAHEPATFACWLVLSFPILFGYVKNKIVVNTKFLIVFIIGLLLTSSATAMLVMLVMLFVVLFYMSIYSVKLFCKIMLFLIIFIPISIYFVGGKINEQALPKVEKYIVEMSGNSSSNESGRSGDKILFQYFNEHPIIGIGMFRSTRVGDPNADAENYISATNFYITIFVEWGIVLGPLLIIAFIFWIFYLKNYINRYNFVWYASIFGWMIMVAGIRVISFYQPWINISLYMSLATKKSLRKVNTDAI